MRTICDCVATYVSQMHPDGVERADPKCGVCDGTGYDEGAAMSDKPLITEEELTDFVSRRMAFATYPGRIYYSPTIAEISEARSLARKMLAAEEMYAALQRITQSDYKRAAVNCCAYKAVEVAEAALKLADSGKDGK